MLSQALVCKIIIARQHFDSFLKGSTIADIKLELSREELDEAERGILPPHDISPNTFLIVGLELEEQQYVF